MMHSTSVQLFQKHLENQTTCSCTLDLERSEAWFPKWPLENISFCHVEHVYVWRGFPVCFLFTPHTYVPSSETRHHGRMTHRWLWGAPSCRCGRCRTVAPASGPCTHTSPGPQSALDQSGGRPSHAERLYLETEGTKKAPETNITNNKYNNKNKFWGVFLLFKSIFKLFSCNRRLLHLNSHHSFADHHKDPS